MKIYKVVGVVKYFYNTESEFETEIDISNSEESNSHILVQAEDEFKLCLQLLENNLFEVDEVTWVKYNNVRKKLFVEGYDKYHDPIQVRYEIAEQR